MLDVDKIKIMTKIAFFEEKEEVEYTPVLKTNRKDYVAEKVLGEFFLSTFIYLVLSVLVIAALFLTVFDNISKAEIILIMVLDIIGYVIFLFYRMGRRRKLAKKEYNDRNKNTRHLGVSMKNLTDTIKRQG